MLLDNLSLIQATIRKSCQSNQRKDSVVLVAVSKKHTHQKIREAYSVGQNVFAENYLQECLLKQSELSDLDICWHYIGHIQSNKTNKIANCFDWVQTVDSLKIAKRLSKQRLPEKGSLNICLQINIDEESSKSGILPSEDILAIAKEISILPNMTLRGLMCIPKNTNILAEKSAGFKKMKGLFDYLNDQGMSLDTLSMGMSADIDLAIACGSTMVRVGTAIFGERS